MNKMRQWYIQSKKIFSVLVIEDIKSFPLNNRVNWMKIGWIEAIWNFTKEELVIGFWFRFFSFSYLLLFLFDLFAKYVSNNILKKLYFPLGTFKRNSSKLTLQKLCLSQSLEISTVDVEKMMSNKLVRLIFWSTNFLLEGNTCLHIHGPTYVFWELTFTGIFDLKREK